MLRSKKIWVTCSRCKQEYSTFQFFDSKGQPQSISGFYNMIHFPLLKQHENETLVCLLCMWSCEKYLEKFSGYL